MAVGRGLILDLEDCRFLQLNDKHFHFLVVCDPVKDVTDSLNDDDDAIIEDVPVHHAQQDGR